LEGLELKNYTASEFLPGISKSGTIVKGVRHEDLQKTSFADNFFDIIISSEVFEHIPKPFQAFAEVYRILKPGGAHVFTVPYVADSPSDINMSFLNPEGIVIDGPGRPPDFIPPFFHSDSFRSEGIIVFTIFSEEILTRLCKLGFDVEIKVIQNENLGIVGLGSIIFTAWK